MNLAVFWQLRRHGSGSKYIREIHLSKKENRFSSGLNQQALIAAPGCRRTLPTVTVTMAASHSGPAGCDSGRLRTPPQGWGQPRVSARTVEARTSRRNSGSTCSQIVTIISCFTFEETKAQKVHITCLKSQVREW